MNPSDRGSVSLGPALTRAQALDDPPRTSYRRATSPEEIEQIHRLNHEVFAREIGQHDPDPSGLLIDKFDGKNIYYLAVRRGEVVGMVAVHDQPPFSIADRLTEPATIERLPGRPLEVRLLAVRSGVRQGLLFHGLLWQVHEHAHHHGHSHLLITGVEARVPLYERLGFRSLGPAVVEGRVRFVPMGLDLTAPPPAYRRTVDQYRSRWTRLADKRPRISLLPGPVEVAPSVAAAFRARPRSHRDPEVIAIYEQVRARLAGLVGGHQVGLFVGGGTLANDVVLATLATIPSLGRGLILSNGEFGERLTRQALRFGLAVDVLRWPWGQPWDLAAVTDRLERSPTIGWVHGVHLETSTGMLNDLAGLVESCRHRGVLICADVVSSLGAVEVDLAGVDLAASASGKSLGAYAGLGIVFAGRGVLDGRSTGRGPASLDLAEHLRSVGPPSTVPSSVVGALDQSLRAIDSPESRAARYQDAAALGARCRQGLRALGLVPITAEPWAAPVVTSFPLPLGWDEASFRTSCRAIGFEVATASRYLSERRWAQVATMGAIAAEQVDSFLDGLSRLLARSF